jgi:SAM-dependent methyltransferase
MADDFWESAAQQDPLWAILSDPAMRGRQWKLREFFESGRREISLLEYQLRQLGHFPPPNDALDFGCGVGRLSQALAERFARVQGVDVSPTMVRLAERLNRFPGVVRYVLNDAPDLPTIADASIDLVYSDIVLQHLEPERAAVYIAEFIRVLRPGGTAVFQLPSHLRPVSEAPARPAPMPHEAYVAGLRVLEPPPPSLAPGAECVVIVDVTNRSPVDWELGEATVVRAGNHWRSAHGDMVIQDDGRAALPAMLKAGESCRVALTVRAPADAGDFVCEVDLVHEGVTWFADRGSVTAGVAVTVGSGAATASSASSRDDVAPREGEDAFPDIYAFLPAAEGGDIGEFPMFGIPQRDVLSLIERHGGVTFHVEDDERGGPEWAGYRYYVTKR